MTTVSKIREELQNSLEEGPVRASPTKKKYVTRCGYCLYSEIKESWQLRFRRFGESSSVGVLGGNLPVASASQPTTWLGRLDAPKAIRRDEDPPIDLVYMVLKRAELRELLRNARNQLQKTSQTYFQKLTMKLRNKKEIDLVPILKQILGTEKISKQRGIKALECAISYTWSLKLVNDSGWKLTLSQLPEDFVDMESLVAAKVFVNECLEESTVKVGGKCTPDRQQVAGASTGETPRNQRKRFLPLPEENRKSWDDAFLNKVGGSDVKRNKVAPSYGTSGDHTCRDQYPESCCNLGSNFQIGNQSHADRSGIGYESDSIKGSMSKRVISSIIDPHTDSDHTDTGEIYCSPMLKSVGKSFDDDKIVPERGSNEHVQALPITPEKIDPSKRVTMKLRSQTATSGTEERFASSGLLIDESRKLSKNTHQIKLRSMKLQQREKVDAKAAIVDVAIGETKSEYVGEAGPFQVVKSTNAKSTRKSSDLDRNRTSENICINKHKPSPKKQKKLESPQVKKDGMLITDEYVRCNDPSFKTMKNIKKKNINKFDITDLGFISTNNTNAEINCVKTEQLVGEHGEGNMELKINEKNTDGTTNSDQVTIEPLDDNLGSKFKNNTEKIKEKEKRSEEKQAQQENSMEAMQDDNLDSEKEENHKDTDDSDDKGIKKRRTGGKTKPGNKKVQKETQPLVNSCRSLRSSRLIKETKQEAQLLVNSCRSLRSSRLIKENKSKMVRKSQSMSCKDRDGLGWSKLDHNGVISDFVYCGNSMLPFGSTPSTALKAVEKEFEKVGNVETLVSVEEQKLYNRTSANRKRLMHAEKAARQKEKLQFKEQAKELKSNQRHLRKSQQQVLYEDFIDQPIMFEKDKKIISFDECPEKNFCIFCDTLDAEVKVDSLLIPAPSFCPSNLKDQWRENFVTEQEPEMTSESKRAKAVSTTKRRRRRTSRSSNKTGLMLREMQYTLNFIEKYNQGYLE